jgi:hypothetical protein
MIETQDQIIVLEQEEQESVELSLNELQMVGGGITPSLHI